MKRGTRIEVYGIGADGSDIWYPAKIGRQPKGGYPVVGYYCIVFDEGGTNAAHKSRFRVVESRASARK